MTAMKKKKMKFIIGGVAVAAVVAYLAISGARQGIVYYFTVGEFTAKAASFVDQGTRVSGKVLKGSIKKDTLALDINFVISDGNAQLPVFYHGVVPDIFGENVDVVVEGKYSPEGVFKASTLLTKCPSKFEGEG